jgi:oligoendopeptidase F
MKIKTQWNLGLLYKSDKDPQIEKDLQDIENTYISFEKKYKNKAFTASPVILARAIKDYEKLVEKTGGSKPWWYFALKGDLDSNDTKAAANSTKFDQRLAMASNRIKFFRMEIAKIPVNKHQQFLKHPALKNYSYFIERIFIVARYYLTLGEEQLEDLLSQPSYSMWVDATQKLLNQQVVKHKGKEMPIVEAMNKESFLPKLERRKLHIEIYKVLRSISQAAEAEINAIYNYKKVMDERRGFAQPYSATLIGNENDEKSIEAFIALVTKNFHIAQRFYKIHAKLLGDKKVTMADRNASVGEISTKFDFPTSVEMLRTSLENFDPEFKNIFDEYLQNGQIDVYPKKGKKGGAYCWGMGKLPIFVLLNHVNEVRSLEVLAHEMGHAIHGEMSATQPVLYDGHTFATAEVASTFFETVIGDEIEKKLSKKEQIIHLHSKLSGDMASIFRQIACFNFENELHNRIRNDGQLSKEDIAKLMNKHIKSYVGPAVEVTEDDGYIFVSWSHIRRFFYVYTYAYGQLISRALYENWKEDKTYAAKIKQFLKAGKSMTPEDIFKSIGIDTSKMSFFEAGLKGIEKDIERLEKLVK